ncbi:MAG: molybdopterin dinucleotide binding domain-containing protein [bacterium]
METKTTTCPFCLNGCTSAVVFDGYQYRMEYPADGPVNRGRLCARGNSASVVIDHPKRLAYPLLDGRPIAWPEAERLVRAWRAAVKPKEVALVYSRGRGADEAGRMFDLAREIGTDFIVCGHIEPENAFSLKLEGVKDATLAELEAAKAMLLVGDVFNTSPVATGRMLDARYADRKNRLVVIDSVRTRQSGFAHVFIQVRPGTEPLALVALAGLLDGKLKADVDAMAAAAGVSRGQLAAAAAVLGAGVPGFVGCAAHFGRVYHPALHSLAAQLVAVKAKMPFTGFRETGLPYGQTGFTELRQALGQGRVRLLFWTGGLYPYSYAEIFPEAAKAEYRVATSIFIPDPPVPGLVLPVTAELEKSARAQTYWGPATREPLAAPLSGSRDSGRVLELLYAAPAARREGERHQDSGTDSRRVAPGAVVAMATKAAGLARGGEGFLLVGEKKAIGLRGFYDPEDRLSLNPEDAVRLGADGDSVIRVTSPTGAREFQALVTEQVPPGVAMVGTNVHENRALFPLALDESSGMTTVTPVNVTVEKLAGAVQPPVVAVPDSRGGRFFEAAARSDKTRS